MKRIITYGTYDMLHYGHIRLLERAKALGDYLIVGITSGSFDWGRGKLNVKQSLTERIEAVRDTGIADEIIIEEYEGQKIDDIRRYDIDIFTVGSDWVGYFDYLNEYCDVIYLDRTEGVSSSELRAKERELRVGLVGNSNSELEKFAFESQYVNGVEIAGVYSDRKDNLSEQLLTACTFVPIFDQLLELVDALYLVSHPEQHFDQIKTALEYGKHVLCESPVAMSADSVKELFNLAKEHDCILMESIKTAYSLAFSRLQLIVKSGFIGDVISVEATCTSLQKNEGDKRGSMHSWGAFGLLPIFSVLGTEYNEQIIYTALDETGKDIFTKIDFVYNGAIASMRVGNGVKSEGNLVISGTKGYVYVPAPWWKTDYFEVRYENQNSNKRYFYQLEGEGIRYTIVSFLKSITKGKLETYIPENITVAIADTMNAFNNKRNTVVL